VKQKALLATVFFALVPAALCQVLQSGMLYVNIRPQMAVQGFDLFRPTGVRITSLNMNAHSLMNKVTITNYSTKAVTSIEYGWRVSAPASCSDTVLPVRWETATANVSIAPNGGEAGVAVPESLSRAGASEDLAAQARASNTPVVLVTIGIVTVTFADGSTWSDNEAVERHMFDNGRAEREESCAMSPGPNTPAS
jgi:hypothetical protein